MIPVTMFIENFKSGFDREYLEEIFLNGNCYHFALILESMYDGEIIYDPHDFHFITKIEGKYYDITGEVEKPLDEYIWNEMEDLDYNEYTLIEHSCVYKL